MTANWFTTQNQNSMLKIENQVNQSQACQKQTRQAKLSKENL